MNKFTSCIILVISLFAFFVRVSCAQDIASSATFKNSPEKTDFDYRVENLKRYLENINSPLSPYSQDFVKYADANGLDYRLIPSISGVESTFGKSIPPNSYNAYGWSNGEYSFKSWHDSIGTVSDTLKVNYLDKGAYSIGQIARRYAPPSNTWASKVEYFVNKIDPLPLNFDII